MEQEVVYSVIRRTLKKELPELVECPRRGIRKLLDLGLNYFADGAKEKRFFSWMQDKLRDPNNPYYKYMEHIAANVCHDLLATFITNLGYNSLSYGADRIRSTTNRKGFHVPWLLTFDAGSECPDWLMSLWGLIDQGKSLGIYSYMIKLDSNTRVLRSILNLIEHERECAFFLQVSGGLINDIMLERIVASQNVFLLLELDYSNSNTKDTVDVLQEYKCLYGGIATHSNDPQEAHLVPEHAATEGIHTLFFIENGDEYRQGTTDGISSSRIYEREDTPLLTLDFDEIAFYLDASVTGQACLGMIDHYGEFGYMEPGSHMVNTGFNVLEDELETILAQTMLQEVES